MHVYESIKHEHLFCMWNQGYYCFWYTLLDILWNKMKRNTTSNFNFGPIVLFYTVHAFNQGL